MPVMGGLEAIPKLLKIQPGVKIIMCSTLTSENAQTSLKAMELGAVDCIAKPSSTQDMYSKDTFRDILTHTVLSIAGFNEERKNNSSSSKLNIFCSRDQQQRTTSPNTREYRHLARLK
jgi:chemotaxis response regulator CheB